MKRLVSLIIVLSLLSGSIVNLNASKGHDDDDHNDHEKGSVKEIMHQVKNVYGKIQKSVKQEDYFETASHLMKFAHLFRSLEDAKLKKGSRTEWNKNHNQIIDECFRGIGACGNKDMKGLKKSLDEINKLYKKGHAKFK